MKREILKSLKNTFGETAEVIDIYTTGEDTAFVFSKREKSGDVEFMVHNAYLNKDKCSYGFENGHYIPSFADGARLYLSKYSRQKITVPVSESDIQDLQCGESFEWVFEDQFGVDIDVIIEQE